MADVDPRDILLEDEMQAHWDVPEDDPHQYEIPDDEIQVLEDKHVCVFWSHRGSERTSIGASVKNPYDKTSSNYDSCSSPDMETEAALPACTYNIMDQNDAEIYCPFYEAEQDYLLFETKKGEVRTTRILDFGEMNMDRTFTATMADGSVHEFDNPTEAYDKIRE